VIVSLDNGASVPLVEVGDTALVIDDVDCCFLVKKSIIINPTIDEIRKVVNIIIFPVVRHNFGWQVTLS